MKMNVVGPECIQTGAVLDLTALLFAWSGTVISQGSFCVRLYSISNFEHL